MNADIRRVVREPGFGSDRDRWVLVINAAVRLLHQPGKRLQWTGPDFLYGGLELSALLPLDR
jgi:hypothetical protein